jgi:ATP-dependent helicase/DNAse subunit B
LFAQDAIEVETFGPHQVVAEKADSAWSRRELIHAAIHHVWCQPGHDDAWEDTYKSLHSLMPERLEEKATIEDARMGLYAGQIDPALVSPSRFSPSALEQYAACPFTYFVSEVMNLVQWDEAQEGFDALSSGSVWHEVLAAFLGQLRGKKLEPAALEKYAQELSHLLEAAVARRELQGRVVPDVWWRFEKPRWEKALRSWLAGELERQAETQMAPCFFEWAFGTPLRYGSDPASTEQPLTFDGNAEEASVEIKGKVDRIDAAGSLYRIIDYKTGKPPARKQVAQGIRLQVPLYMMAVEKLLCKSGEMASDGMYLPVGSTTPELKLPGSKISKDEMFTATKQFVFRYVSEIRGGKFPAQPAGACPNYCIARTFCRREAEPDGEGTEETADE